MIKRGPFVMVGARMFGLIMLVLFPITSVVVVCYDNKAAFKKFYTDCVDILLLRNTENW